MAACAIDPVQFQLLIKSWACHETFQFCDSHVRRILENHVLPHHLDGVLNFSAGKPQPPHDRLRHLTADAIVFVKTDATRFIYGRRDGFGNVVKQHGENQRNRNLLRKQPQHQPGVHEHVAFRMKLFRLQHAFHTFQLRQNGAHQAAGIEQIPAADPVRREKNAHQLVANSFGANLIDRRRAAYESLPRFLVNLVIKHGSKTHGPQHSQPIFRETLRGVADGTH